MTEGFPKPSRRDGQEPCGECHIKPDETCDICGARHAPSDAKSVKSLADEIEREMMAWRGANGGIYTIRACAFAIAQKVSAMLDAAPDLENGPAVLADAHTNPPLSDLSSLRKGAEAVAAEREECAETALHALHGVSLAGVHRKYGQGLIDGLSMAADAIRARAALVSGSREDGE